MLVSVRGCLIDFCHANSEGVTDFKKRVDI